MGSNSLRGCSIQQLDLVKMTCGWQYYRNTPTSRLNSKHTKHYRNRDTQILLLFFFRMCEANLSRCTWCTPFQKISGWTPRIGSHMSRSTNRDLMPSNGDLQWSFLTPIFFAGNWIPNLAQGCKGVLVLDLEDWRKPWGIPRRIWQFWLKLLLVSVNKREINGSFCYETSTTKEHDDFCTLQIWDWPEHCRGSHVGVCFA